MAVDEFEGAIREEGIRGILSEVDRQAALRALTTESLGKIGNIGDDTREAVRAALSSSVAKGETVQQAASRLLGETNLGRGVFKSARTRASLVARTELHRARQRGLVDLANAENFRLFTWVTVGDERVCSICEPWHGETRFRRDFPFLPPAHPNCRCLLYPGRLDPGSRPISLTPRDPVNLERDALGRYRIGISPWRKGVGVRSIRLLGDKDWDRLAERYARFVRRKGFNIPKSVLVKQTISQSARALSRQLRKISYAEVAAGGGLAAASLAASSGVSAAFADSVALEMYDVPDPDFLADLEIPPFPSEQTPSKRSILKAAVSAAARKLDVSEREVRMIIFSILDEIRSQKLDAGKVLSRIKSSGRGSVAAVATLMIEMSKEVQDADPEARSLFIELQGLKRPEDFEPVPLF